MPNKRDIKLDEYGISKYAYRELLNFCLQYDEKKQQLTAIRDLNAVAYNGTPHGSSISNPTQDKAERAARLSNDIKLIEQTAIETDSGIYQDIISNVTNINMTYEVLNPPCGRRQFYTLRRKFFFILNKNKNG